VFSESRGISFKKTHHILSKASTLTLFVYPNFDARVRSACIPATRALGGRLARRGALGAHTRAVSLRRTRDGSHRALALALRPLALGAAWPAARAPQ